MGVGGEGWWQREDRVPLPDSRRWDFMEKTTGD